MMQAAISWDDLKLNSGAPMSRAYSANNIILFQGEIPPRAWLVDSGFVVSYTINNNGDEQIIGFFSAGDIIPAEWVFSRSPVSLYYYRAFTECTLISLARNELLAQIESNRVLARKLLYQFASSFIGATVHIHALEHSYAKEKVTNLLHYLILRFGKPVDKDSDTYTLPFKLTHAHIASMVGIARESVATEAVKLKKRGVLGYNNGIYTIKLPGLIASLGGEEFSALKIQSPPSPA